MSGVETGFINEVLAEHTPAEGARNYCPACVVRHPCDVHTAITQLTADLAAANAIVEKTADGVPVHTLTHVWVRQANSVEGGQTELRAVMPKGRIAYKHPDSYGFIGARSSMCYSTAEAARMNGGE